MIGHSDSFHKISNVLGRPRKRKLTVHRLSMAEASRKPRFTVLEFEGCFANPRSRLHLKVGVLEKEHPGVRCSTKLKPEAFR